MAKIQLTRQTTKYFCEKPVDKCVEKPDNKYSLSKSRHQLRDIHRLIKKKKDSFSLIYAEKKYKLINFAPK